ncbi:uncharacterized protein LOC119165615 [Rhipicephalus microplus]|uniref:uncharacterized protein LOC119165615 n=1 Tax=Rhipicephalus microplus TaxID=6941 RepID=UPI003F6B070D
MNLTTLLVVVQLIVFSVSFSTACHGDDGGFEEQHEIDPVNKDPYPPHSVGPGGRCQSTLECQRGWCCARQRKWNGGYTCQKMHGLGRRCTMETQIKAGRYYYHCPCVSHLACRGNHALKLCVPKNWSLDDVTY